MFGSEHINTRKDGETGGVTKVTEERRHGYNTDRWWHGKVTSETDLKGRDETGGVEQMVSWGA